VVPVLVFLEGRSVRDAVIAATVSFVGSGLVALYVWLRQERSVPAGHRGFLLATAPGALRAPCFFASPAALRSGC
jgi:hypothetical protein